MNCAHGSDVRSASNRSDDSYGQRIPATIYRLSPFSFFTLIRIGGVILLAPLGYHMRGSPFGNLVGTAQAAEQRRINNDIASADLYMTMFNTRLSQLYQSSCDLDQCRDVQTTNNRRRGARIMCRGAGWPKAESFITGYLPHNPGTKAQPQGSLKPATRSSPCV